MTEREQFEAWFDAEYPNGDTNGCAWAWAGWIAKYHAARAAAPAHDNKSDVIERAQLWLDEAHRRGINVTDENGYLAVIRDLVSEVEFQRTELQGYRNEQERLIDECKRAWKEVDVIAKERDDNHRWRQDLADDLGKVEKTRDVLARTVNDQERELGLLRVVRDAAADLCDDAEEYECEGLGLFAQHGSWEPLHDALDAVRPCTCHPDDKPPVPCPRKFALSECRAAAPERVLSSGKWSLADVGVTPMVPAAPAEAWIDQHVDTFLSQYNDVYCDNRKAGVGGGDAERAAMRQVLYLALGAFNGAEVERLRARLQAVIEVYAGMEGFIPQTAPEGYLLHIVGQMKDAALQEKP